MQNGLQGLREKPTSDDELIFQDLYNVLHDSDVDRFIWHTPFLLGWKQNVSVVIRQCRDRLFLWRMLQGALIWYRILGTSAKL